MKAGLANAKAKGVRLGAPRTDPKVVARITKEKAKGTDAAAIKSAIEQLEAASHAFSKVLYERGGAGGAGGDAGPGPAAAGQSSEKKPDDDVIEGEFEVKK